MNQSDTLIIDTTERIFREFAAPQAVLSDFNGIWRSSLWTALEEAGLTLAWVAEKNGGSGAEIKDGFNIIEMAGRYALSIPLAETLLAGWLLGKGGLRAPMGPMTVAFGTSEQPLTIKDEKLYGCGMHVPFRNTAQYFVCLANGELGPQVSLVEFSTSDLTNRSSISKHEIGAISFDGVEVQDSALLPNAFSSDDLQIMGAAVRAQQMAGALQSMLKLSVDYAQGREAFGRPIGKFQAVQQNLARLAGETAAATAAAGSAADTIQNAEHFDTAVIFEVAAAKIRTGEAATEGSAISHQVHGAMGFTAEHILHMFTQRLFLWREDFGTETEWAVKLGSIVAANGADQLWPMVASR